MANKPLQSVLIKPAGPDCNLGCTYCFYLKKTELFKHSTARRMPLDTLEEVVKQVMIQGPDSVSFGWQGGEPTLMGLSFFQKAVEFQQRFGRGQIVDNGLQTNGLLIDKKWVEFLKAYNFLVGLSIDGPENVHDRYRTTRGGSGSWSKVSGAARLLLDSGVDTNAVTVVNDHSVDYPEDIYRSHKDMGFDYMQFIPCIEPDPTDPSRAAPFSVSPEKYGRFLIALFDLWRADFRNGAPTTSVRYFDSLLHLYLGRQANECALHKRCGDYVVVEHNGDVYSCDFYVDPEWRLGNVHQGRLVDMLNAPRQARFGGRKEAVASQCRSCRYLAICRGGCPKDRRHNPRNLEISYFCKAYQIFLDHADAQLRVIAKRLTSGPAQSMNPHPKPSGQPKVSQVGRNQPCPCGSGKKFKRCCGGIKKQQSADE